MSKRVIGKYEDGSVKHSYFRRFKHHRIKRNGFSRIRFKMWIAKVTKVDTDLDRAAIRTFLLNQKTRNQIEHTQETTIKYKTIKQNKNAK